MAGCVGLNRLQCSPTHEHCSTELSRPAPGACAGSTAATPPPTTSAPAPAITAAPNGLPEPLPERRCREWGQVPWGRKGGMAAGAAGSAGEGARTGAGARADRAARAGAHAEPHRPGERGSRPRRGGGQGASSGADPTADSAASGPTSSAARSARSGRVRRRGHTRRGWYATARSSSSPPSTPSPTSPHAPSRRAPVHHLGLHSLLLLAWLRLLIRGHGLGAGVCDGGDGALHLQHTLQRLLHQLRPCPRSRLALCRSSDAVSSAAALSAQISQPQRALRRAPSRR